MNRRAISALPLFAWLPIALAAAPALAADPPKSVPSAPSASDPAAAQSLFYDARKLMEQNKFAEACPKLEESLRLDPGLGTQFNLADCNEHLGKITTAWAGFLEVAAESKSSNQPDRERLARKRAAALEPRLPKLVVEVPGAAALPGLEVRRDGVAVGAAAWGTAIPVDPGAHRIVVTAPGKQAWNTSVTASEANTARVTVPRDLPAAPIAAAGPPAPNGAPPQPFDNTSFPQPIDESRGGTQRAVGWIVTGLGAVGASVGGGFGLSSLSKRNDSRSHCVADQCDSTGVGLRDDAMKAGNIATIATIAGGAAVAGGLILVLTAPKGTQSRERAAGTIRAVPNVALGGGGFTLQGDFR
jgi:hypothetical protein